LIGNHELMLVRGQHHYVEPGAWSEGTAAASDLFAASVEAAAAPGALSGILPAPTTPARARDALAHLALWSPGGPLAAELGARSLIGVAVDDTLFGHAGAIPTWLVKLGPRTLSDVNAATSAWLAGAPPPDYLSTDVLRRGAGGPGVEVALSSPYGPVWTRAFAGRPVTRGNEVGLDYVAEAECALLHATLAEATAEWSRAHLANPASVPPPPARGLRRMVVGHTPQLGRATSGCEGRLIRLDTAMSAKMALPGFGSGPPTALELVWSGGVGDDDDGLRDATLIQNQVGTPQTKIEVPLEEARVVIDTRRDPSELR